MGTYGKSTGTRFDWFQMGLKGVVATFVIAAGLCISGGVADADKVTLKSGNTVKGEAEVGGDIIRLDLGKQGILTLPDVRVKKVYDTEKNKNIYFRGEVRGRKGIQMGTIGIVGSSGGRPSPRRQQQQARPAARSNGQRQRRPMRRGAQPGARRGGGQPRRQGGRRGPQGGVQGRPRRQGRPGRPQQGGGAGRPPRPQQEGGTEGESE